MYSKINQVDALIHPSVIDETAPLKQVILGTAESLGPVPALEDLYDPSSRMHLLAGSYPREADMKAEMEGFEQVLKSHGAEVFRPEVLQDCNQIFARDIGFVVGKTFFSIEYLTVEGRRIRSHRAIDQEDSQGALSGMP